MYELQGIARPLAAETNVNKNATAAPADRALIVLSSYLLRQANGHLCYFCTTWGSFVSPIASSRAVRDSISSVRSFVTPRYVGRHAFKGPSFRLEGGFLKPLFNP